MKKRRETSKKFLYFISFLTTLIIGLSFWVVVKYKYTDILTYLIPSTFTELTAATGVYYWKSKSENKIKMILSAVKELSKLDDLTAEQVQIVEALINTLS